MDGRFPDLSPRQRLLPLGIRDFRPLADALGVSRMQGALAHGPHKPQGNARRRKPRKPRRERSKKRAGARRKPIDLYYWPTPNGWKITIMLEECGLPYTMIPVDISKGDQFKPEFLAISPNNRMPAIVDHGGPGGKPISVFESGAILQYLGRKTGKFYPKDERSPRRGRSNGCSGRWPISVPRQGRRTTSATMRRNNCHTPSTASPTRCIASMAS